MEVINQGMLFAATLLLCLFPFLIVASALAGRDWSTYWPGAVGQVTDGTSAAPEDRPEARVPHPDDRRVSTRMPSSLSASGHNLLPTL